MGEVLGELWNGEEECRLECICGEGARRRRDGEKKTNGQKEYQKKRERGGEKIDEVNGE